MTRLTIRSAPCPPPPENLDPVLHTAFAELCERLRAGGAEILPVDAVVIARTVQAEAALQRAREAAAKAPLCVDSPANGESLHPLHRLVTTCEANLRSWLRLLPRAGSGGRIPSSHVTPAPAPAGGDVAEPPGQPSERLQRLRAIIRAFQASADAPAADGGAVVDAAAAGDGVVGAAAGAGGCVDAAGGAAE